MLGQSSRSSTPPRTMHLGSRRERSARERAGDIGGAWRTGLRRDPTRAPIQASRKCPSHRLFSAIINLMPRPPLLPSLLLVLFAAMAAAQPLQEQLRARIGGFQGTV